jgi:hypothetical protein
VIGHDPVGGKLPSIVWQTEGTASLLQKNAAMLANADRSDRQVPQINAPAFRWRKKVANVVVDKVLTVNTAGIAM